jgi:hypothetical protein
MPLSLAPTHAVPHQAHTCAKAVRLGAAQVGPEAPAFRSHPHQDMHFTAKGIADIISKVCVLVVTFLVMLGMVLQAVIDL